jgi:SAM-dependent methyltransferase
MPSKPEDSHNRFDLDRVWDSFSDRERLRVEATLELVGADISRLLDVGAGDGRLTRCVASRTEHAVALDFSRSALTRATELKMRVQGSVLHLPFSDAIFDVVVATEVLEHLSETDRARAFRELARVCTGRVLVTVPFRETLAEEMCLCARCHAVFHAYGHTRSFTERDLMSVEGALSIERLEAIVPIRKGRPLRLLRSLRMRLGQNYAFDASARCPACGGLACAVSGNILGTLARIACDLVDRAFPLREPGWLLAVYRKQNA